MLTRNMQLDKEVKAWVKRKHGPDEIIRVIPALEDWGTVTAYHLYNAFDTQSDYLGDILFDAQGFWIYNGDIFTVDEQEQLAHFIINYTERL